MLVVRDAQLRSFERAADRAYLGRVLDLVERLAPGVLSDQPTEQREKRAEQAFRRASEFGCQTALGTGLFIAAMFIGGPGFENDPECAEIMNDRTAPPDARVSYLFCDLAEIPWGSVRGRCMNNAW